MNNEFKKSVEKGLANQNLGELSPGATDRRYEPEGGVKKLNERIHRESAWADKNQNLPFSFSKPHKPTSKPAVKVCGNCKAYVSVNRNTIGVVCPSCKQYSSVEELPIEEE